METLEDAFDHRVTSKCTGKTNTGRRNETHINISITDS